MSDMHESNRISGPWQSPLNTIRKRGAAEVILDELEGWGSACFEQGHISKEFHDGLMECIPTQRVLLKGEDHENYTTFSQESDGVFKWACMTYAFLWDEMSRKNDMARKGYKSIEGAKRSHAGYHEATEEMKVRRDEVRKAFLEMQRKVWSNGKHPTKAQCHTQLAINRSLSLSTIKRYCRGL